jgi:hypothetical protein
MKRISLFIFAAALMISFVACSGSKKEEKATEVIESPAEVKAPEVVTPPTKDPTPEEAIKAFQAFAKEYVDAFNNITKDPQKFTKLGSQTQEKVADMERLKINFNAKQLKEYEKAKDLIFQVNTPKKK